MNRNPKRSSRAQSPRVLPLRGATIAVALLVGAFAASCGGGSSSSLSAMQLVEFQIVDRALQPAAPTGSVSVPRNAQFRCIFNGPVLGSSISFQTIQVRTGGSFQSIPGGSFRVTGNEVIYDPTLEVDGTPRPFGLDPLSQYSLDIPSIDEQPGVVKNLDLDPNRRSFFTNWTTSAGFLRELQPPEVEGVYFVPDPDPITRNIPGNGLLAIVFNEVMDPASFTQAPFAGPDPSTGVDIRYTSAPINGANGVADAPVPGTFSHDASATTFFFRPTFSFGNAKLIFTVAVYQVLKDLSGNQLVNPQSWGPFTCDGEGIATGKVIREDFDVADERDSGASDADWGSDEEGWLKGQPVTSRDVVITGTDYDAGSDYSGDGYSGSVAGPHAGMQAGAAQAVTGGRGMYITLDAPLVGQDRNNYTPAPNPATSLGRRVMQTYSDQEMGPKGSITRMGIGPDNNATFSSTYNGVILRFGYQKNDSMNLATSFNGNYSGSPTEVYRGSFSVAQKANVGNYPTTNNAGTTATSAFNPCTTAHNNPLYQYTGHLLWPVPTTFFKWDPGTGDVNDSVLLFDMSVPESAGTFQQVRAWWAQLYPCAGYGLGLGSFIGGFPTRFLLAGFEEDTPNPPENLSGGAAQNIKNPDHIIIDALFTLSKVESVAQSQFYGPPGHVWTSAAGETFGTDTDYLTPEIDPALQTGGAQVILEFQGAMAVEPDRRTINGGFPSTAWTREIDDCDGFPFIRWRATLLSNLLSGQVARVSRILIPMVSN
ncbi:MAG: hypothetical protein AB7T63_12490 [Planctomycetota bacterium]